VRRGVVPDAYSHWTVPRAIGYQRVGIPREHWQSGEAFDLCKRETLVLVIPKSKRREND
jgi:hypothetical protein